VSVIVEAIACYVGIDL